MLHGSFRHNKTPTATPAEEKPIRIKLPTSWRKPIESVREETEVAVESSSLVPVVRRMPAAPGWQDYSGPSGSSSRKKDVFDATTSQFFMPATRRPFEPLFGELKQVVEESPDVVDNRYQLPLARQDVSRRQHRPVVHKKHISSLPVKSISSIPSYYSFIRLN